MTMIDMIRKMSVVMDVPECSKKMKLFVFKVNNGALELSKIHEWGLEQNTSLSSATS